MRIRARPAVGPASGKIVQATGSSSRFGSETKQHFADSHQVVFTGSYRQCVVRNAKLSQCETVRNVSHGLRRRTKRAKRSGSQGETVFRTGSQGKIFSGSSPAYRNCSVHV